MTPYASLGSSFPPPGWSVVGPETPAAVVRARELARVMPPSHYEDEEHGGECWRFFTYEDGRGRAGVGCLRWDGSPMLGDTAAAAPASAWDSGAASWWLLGGALALAAGVLYLSTRPLEAHASSSERRRERDEFAEQNIPDELVPLWRRERSRFRGTPHERSEAFLEWAETGEGEAARVELLEEQSGGRVDDLLLEREGCRCNDGDSPRCCGRGCCSWHRGIRERIGEEVPF